MANRYISSDERTKQLAYGMYVYSMAIDEREGQFRALWENWRKVWGEKMAAQVIKVNFDNMTWAINYREEGGA